MLLPQKRVSRLPLRRWFAQFLLAKIPHQAADALEMVAVDFTYAARTSKTYEEYERKLAAKETGELEYLGLALYGERKTVERLTGNLPLLR